MAVGHRTLATILLKVSILLMSLLFFAMHPYCLTPRFLCWGCHNYVYFVERLLSLHRNYLSPKGIGRSDLGGIIPTGITLIIGASYWSLIVVIKNAVRASTHSRSLQSVYNQFLC